ncbi:hypothetical protein ACFLXE_05635 [Chloroflexota bacterium]
MVTDELTGKMAEQLQVVVDRAGEVFVDLLEEGARDSKISIGSISEPDKRYLERLFSQVVYGQVVAEAAAILSFLVHAELHDDRVVTWTVPTFMDRCEGRLDEVPESMPAKTGGLVELARGVLDSGVERGEVATCLLQDIAGMAPVRPMRAAFDAVVLSLLGE